MKQYKPPVLSFDIMEKVGENVKYIREKVWLSEHKQEMSNCFQEMSKKWSDWKATEEGQEWLYNIDRCDNYPDIILENSFNFLSDIPDNGYGFKQRLGKDFWLEECNKQYMICWDDPTGNKGLWDNERDEFCPRFGVW
tara:strand:+ start:126 stop:539 length:414 start_codon:yes stop_codon:yes gene_type:complete